MRIVGIQKKKGKKKRETERDRCICSQLVRVLQGTQIDRLSFMQLAEQQAGRQAAGNETFFVTCVCMTDLHKT